MAQAKRKKQAWEKRQWLEPNGDADSYIKASVFGYDGSVDLKIADCNRNISLGFSGPGNKEAIAKAKRLKDVVDGLYAYLTKADAN